jgi:DNA-binding IclR family transcriptional regulator
MPTSFREWLNRPDEAPAAERLAIQIALAGPAGISLEGLARAVGVPPQSLQDILRALVTSGQVTMLRVGGRLVYRAAG